VTGRLTLVCHAATSAVRRACFPLDEPIEARGQALAGEMAPLLGRVDVAWTSPALRARQTAVALGLAAVPDPVLADIDSGRWSGRALQDVEAEEPDAVRHWATRPDAAPHGGESVLDLLARLRPWMDRRLMDDRRSVAVTHAAVIRAAMVLAIGAPPDSFWRIDVGPLCRVELRAGGGAWRLRGML
jgi:broad specificity phosphatase PhoE